MKLTWSIIKVNQDSQPHWLKHDANYARGWRLMQLFLLSETLIVVSGESIGFGQSNVKSHQPTLWFLFVYFLFYVFGVVVVILTVTFSKYKWHEEQAFQWHQEWYADDALHVLVFNSGSWLFVLNVHTTCQIWAMAVFQMWQEGGWENMKDSSVIHPL